MARRPSFRDGSLPDVSLQQMLEEQMDLLQRALAFNQAIASKAASDRLLALASSAREASNSPQRRADQFRQTLPEQHVAKASLPVKAVQESENLLTEPLLSSAGPAGPMPSCSPLRSPTFGTDRTCPDGGHELEAGTQKQKLPFSKEAIMRALHDHLWHYQHNGSLRMRAHGIRSRCRTAASRLVRTEKEVTEAPTLEEAASVDIVEEPKHQNRVLTPPQENPHDENAALKNSIKFMLKAEGYDVEDFYKATGRCQQIARSSLFKSTTFAMVILSTIWLAVDTDYNKASILCNASLIFQIADNFICVYFLVELLVRFMAFRCAKDAFNDTAFNLDLFLVLSMITDTWLIVLLYLFSGDRQMYGGSPRILQSLRIIRLIRITRALRMSRLFRAVPELLVLVNGMVLAIRSVLTTLGMLVLVTYTFAIVMTQLFSDIKELEGKFDTVPVSTNFLLLQVLCGWDSATFQTLLQVGSGSGYVLLMLYLLVASLTIMNMLVGILVDVVGNCANEQDEENQLKELKQNIADLISLTDSDGDNTVTHEEFFNMLRDRGAVQKLYKGGVNVHALADFANFFFRDCDEMAVDEFVEAVLQFRGASQATGKDLVDLKVHMSHELARLQNHDKSQTRDLSKAPSELNR
eukprot:TRINITY_DN18490_c0_g2_i1.p1 TRINITY_DN18490_c0_g2~~TRINITY_DN18490_c0_g2_i1.p1  ORF type:complete len:651 (-),score=121.77 TRINITY_DN18490_c0_g2_i1:55-1965(-)